MEVPKQKQQLLVVNMVEVIAVKTITVNDNRYQLLVLHYSHVNQTIMLVVGIVVVAMETVLVVTITTVPELLLLQLIVIIL